MAHEVETMFSGRGIKPWHIGLTGDATTVVDGTPHAAEAIKLAGLDWQVELKPVFFQSTDDKAAKKGARTPVADRFAVVRDSDQKAFTVVGSKYTPLQNEQAFTFLDNLVDDGLLYETAGSLKGGQEVFITAKLPREILIGGEDAHELYLFIRNGHDGRNAITVGVTPIRVVCQNTLNLGIRAAKRVWSCPHLGTMQGRLAEARESLELTFAYADAFQAEAERLLSEAISEKTYERFLSDFITNAVVGPRAQVKAREGIDALYRHSVTTEFGRGTKWGVLNAVGEYFDWGRETRTEEARLIGSIEGIGVKMRDRALAMLS